MVGHNGGVEPTDKNLFKRCTMPEYTDEIFSVRVEVLWLLVVGWLMERARVVILSRISRELKQL